MLFQPKMETISFGEFLGKKKETEVIDKFTKGLTVSGLTVYALQSGRVFAESAVQHKIIHAFQPIIELLQGVSFPVASVMVTGGAMLFMVGYKNKGIAMVRTAIIGYLIIQFIPTFMVIVADIGSAIAKG